VLPRCDVVVSRVHAVNHALDCVAVVVDYEAGGMLARRKEEKEW
jgi:hypothetical protein